MAIEIERAGQRQTLQVVPAAQTRFEMGDIGVLPEMHPQIRERQLRVGPAEQAGLKTGDVILARQGRTRSRATGRSSRSSTRTRRCRSR